MLDDPDQRAVVLGLRDGHRDAWTALYDGYSSDVWRYVARLIGSSTVDVADVVQETFLAAARSARQYDADRGTLWSWLSGIAHNQTSIYWKQVNRKLKLFELAESNAGQLRRWIDGETCETKLWERREIADIVRSTLSSISADYSTILIAKYVDEMSLDEMTRRFGGTVESTKSKLARARRDFRAKFERLGRHSTAAPDESTVPDESKIE